MGAASAAPTDHANTVREALDWIDAVLDYPVRPDTAPSRAALDALEAERDAAINALRRAVYLAEHLWRMVPREVWRDTGGDDGQGHYEGDYRADKVREELAALAGNQP